MDPKSEPLILDGTTYRLRYGLGAMSALKRDHGINLFEMTEELLTDPVVLQAVLHAGLGKYHPTVTLDEVGDMVGPGDIVPAVTALAAAWAKALGQEVIVEPVDPLTSRPDGTGTRLSDSGMAFSDSGPVISTP